MIHFYFGIGFSVLTLVAAVMAIRQEAQREPFTPAEQINPWRIALWLLALIIALIAPATPSLALKAVIGLALLVLLVGELLMMIPGTPTKIRLGTNSAVYFVVWLILARTVFRALWQQGDWAQFGISAAAGLVALAAAGIYYWRMRVWFRDVPTSGLLYTINAALVVVMAAMLLAAAFSIGSGLLLLGALCLVGADALLGVSKLRKEIARVDTWHIMLQCAAGLLLAWSVWAMLWGETAGLFSVQ